jgi:tetratricopeptide (TPR) repeat protein
VADIGFVTADANHADSAAMLSTRRRLTIACLCAALSLPAAAETINHPERYSDCMAAVETDPEIAFEKGLTWQGLGGGAPAEHCIGAALFALGRYKQAAVRLEDLAQRAVVATPLKVDILTQAARAWMHDGALDHADDLMTTAIALSPEDANLHVHRAEIAAAAGRLRDAIDDLDLAITMRPGTVDALVLRASALRRTDQAAHALLDAEEALVLAPNHPEALLEYGMAARVLGRDSDARKAWLRVLDVEPEGGTADLARRNLELLDVRPDPD